MVGLPRAIIKKYGVTKKAWAVYRGSSGKSRSKRRGVSMGKKRKGGFRRGGMGGIMPYAIGAGIGYFGRPYVQNLPIVSSIPSVAQTPAVAAAIGKFVLKKDPIKMAIGAFVGSMLAGNGQSAGGAYQQ